MFTLIAFAAAAAVHAAPAPRAESVYDASPSAVEVTSLDPGRNRLVSESCMKGRAMAKDGNGVPKDFILRRCVERYVNDRNPAESGIAVLHQATPQGDDTLLVPPDAP